MKHTVVLLRASPYRAICLSMIMISKYCFIFARKPHYATNTTLHYSGDFPSIGVIELESLQKFFGACRGVPTRFIVHEPSDAEGQL